MVLLARALPRITYFICSNNPWAITWSFIFDTILLVSCPILDAYRTADPACRIHVLKSAPCCQNTFRMWILQNWSCSLLQESNVPHLLGVCISVYGWSRISRILLFYCVLGGTKVSLEQGFLIWFRNCLWLSIFLKA